MTNSDIGLEKGIVRLENHNPFWRSLFEKESKILLDTFPDIIQEISHGGSTAIPNIPAKPIIDMFAVVSNLEDTKLLRQELESLGYVYRGEEGVSERILFTKEIGEKQTYHLQFVEKTSNEWKNHLLLKNYYLRHPDVAELYALLKQKLAEQFSDDRQAYSNGKYDFIQSIIAKAKQEEM